MVKVSSHKSPTPPKEPSSLIQTPQSMIAHKTPGTPGASTTPVGFHQGSLPDNLRSFIENGQGRVTSTALNRPVAKGLDNTCGAAPVDFRKMTQDQQYDYLQKMTVQRAGGDPSAWKTGDREANIVGIRSFNGSPQGCKVDQYDDMIYVARMVDGKKTVEGFRASVDAGVQKGSGNAPLRLEDGFYRDAWTRGEVVGGEQGLRQCRDVEVWKDANNDGMLQPEELKAGTSLLATDAQLQFHRGGSGKVGDASAGCQVIDPGQYDRFQQILAEVPASQRDFSYNLTDSSTLPGINPDGSIQDTARDRGHTGKHRHESDRKGGIGIIRTPTTRILW